MIEDIRPRFNKKTVSPRIAAAKTNREESVSIPAFENIEKEPISDNPGIELPQAVKGESDSTPSAFRRFISSRTKKQWALAIALITIVVTGGIAYETWNSRIPPDDNWRPDVSMYKKKEPPKPKTEASRLTGIQISPELNKRPVTGVMIENSPDARPQSGLKEAGVVFEMISEGGITRFMALYQESDPKHIGPIRSVRINFLDFLVPFDAPLAHVGGSPAALQQISHQKIKDIDQMHNPAAYHRRNHRYAPHNMYSSRAELLKLHKKKGYTSSKFIGFARQNEKKSDKPNAANINLNISSALYNLRYEYNAATNSYKRFMGGRPHTDEQSGKQLEPKVIIVPIMPHRPDGIYTIYQTTGSGKAYIFQNGTVTQGIWEKRNRKDQIRFGDKNGSPLALNPGQTWITLAGRQDMVSFR